MVTETNTLPMSSAIGAAPILRRLPIHSSLIRPILLAGGERQWVMMNYTLIATLLFGAGLNTFTILSAVLLATIGHICLVKLAGIDAQLSKIYLRYRRYQLFYPAQSSVWSSNHPVKPSMSRGIRP